MSFNQRENYPTMKGFRRLFLWFLLLTSNSAHSEFIEEKIMTAMDADSSHQFVYNPALIDSSRKYYSFIGMKGKKTSSLLGSPDNNPQNIGYTESTNIQAYGALWPFGGGSGGLSYVREDIELDTDNSSASRILKETKKNEIYAMKFIIEMTPSINFGFHYQYVQAANHLFGRFFINDDDRTNYKAFLSGYRLGIYYQQQKLGVGMYTAPPLRGKALIDGESKIVTSSGTGGLDLKYKLNEKTKIGFGFTRWFYKMDDRLELSTSPVDQRNISLNGVDIDQYLSKIQNIRIGFKHKLRNQLQLTGNLFQQESVFHFDEDGLPGDNRDDIPSFKYLKLDLGLLLDRNRFQLELSYQTESREQDTIIDRTSKLGHRNYVDYSANTTNFLFKMNFST